MALKNQVEELIECAKDYERYLGHNEKLLRIYEGDLLTYVAEDLSKQFSERAYQQILSRCAPINILIKIVDKLSKIYQQNPVRYVEGGTQTDADLLSWYEDSFNINPRMNTADEFYNLFKNCLIQPYVHKRMPKLRIIPSDRFFVKSEDPVDPLNPTTVVLVHGVRRDSTGAPTIIYHAYTDQEFLIYNSRGEILINDMISLGNIEGVNPYGKLPFVYVNKSENNLMPVQDSDTMKMTKLIPILLSDLNYAVMYQSFSLMYGINVDFQNLEKNPDAFLSFKSEDSEHKPEIGFLKPQVDIAEVLNLIQSELALWLNSKGIRPGAIGQLQGDSFASGISKMIDEMDTFEDRKEQVAVFKEAEAQLWDLVLNYMHPVWVKADLLENKTIFTASATVDTDFLEQKPNVSRTELISQIKEEMAAGFMTRFDAIKTLNPQMSDKEIEEYIIEIDTERTITVSEPSMPQDNNPSDGEGRPSIGDSQLHG